MALMSRLVPLLVKSIGGDAALKTGLAEGGKKWDLRVVVAARVDSDYVSLVEAAAKNSRKLVLVGIKGDVNLANDLPSMPGQDNKYIGRASRAVQEAMEARGKEFGDRSYESMTKAIEAKYGTLDNFYKAYPNVSIQASTGTHGGGGDRDVTQDAIRAGVQQIKERMGE